MDKTGSTALDREVMRAMLSFLDPRRELDAPEQSGPDRNDGQSGPVPALVVHQVSQSPKLDLLRREDAGSGLDS